MTEGPDALDRFRSAVGTGGWTSLFPALDDLCQATVGHRLFSCSVFRMTGPQDGVAARVYSSDAASYPVSGLKDIVPNRWTERVIGRGEVFVANSVHGFADVFPDHERIAALGLGSVVNLPLVLRGDFIGTVNLLHRAGHFTEARLAGLGQLILPALLTFQLSLPGGDPLAPPPEAGP